MGERVRGEEIGELVVIGGPRHTLPRREGGGAGEREKTDEER
jgi:hypothetical protein